jgi:hypothetical protein
MPSSVRPLALALALALPATGLAHPSAAEVATTWTGLERAGGTPGTRQFTLELRPAETPATPASGAPRAAQSGLRLTGHWSAQLLSRDRQGRQAAPVVEPVEGEYFPDTGILRVTRRSARGGAGYDCLIVFDADARRLAGVYTGALRQVTPLVAVRGSALDADLSALIGAPRLTGAGAAAAGDLVRRLAAGYTTGDYASAQEFLQQRSTRDTADPAPPPHPTATPAPSPATREPARDLQAELLALNQQMQEAAKARDNARIRELGNRIREVRSAMNQQLIAGRRGSAPAPRSQPAAPTPARIAAWTAQLTALGGSVADFEGAIPASNLFRPRFFVPHFGRSFATLTAAERAAIAREVAGCRANGTPFGNGSLVDPLTGAFENTPGFDTAEAALGGLGLELIADWNLRSVRELDAETDPARIADYELKSTQLVAHLLPRERDETRQQLAALKSRNEGRRLLAQVDGLGRAALDGDVAALRRLVHLPAYADAAKVSAADRANLVRRQTEVLGATVAGLVARARADVPTAVSGMDQLLRGKAWLAAQGELLNLIRDRAEVVAFMREFLAGRAASYAAERAALTREVEGLASKPAAWAFGAAYAVYLDPEASPVWRDLDARRHAKLREFDRAEFHARTGDGPFGPDYPGARYLNALWRDDQRAVEAMDREWREPFLAQLSMLDQIDYTPGLVETFTGGARSADQFRRLRREIAAEASVANGLLVAFAYAFETIYPDCMDRDPPPREVRIHVQHERIVRNLMGLQMARYPDGTSTIIRQINHRHYPAVMDLGIADPNDRIVTEALLGRTGGPVSQLGAATGLARAMEENACTSEIIRRLETGLLNRWRTFAERKRAIHRRIMGRE